MVLAIGLLVDDAIVVVENVERVMHEEGLPPKEATRRSMDQITSALIGIALVLSAVFVPMAFFGGSTGVIYRQFSITIVSAMLLSVVVALTLSPALAATILKPSDPALRRGPLGWFNRGFERGQIAYGRGVRAMIEWRRLFLLVFLMLVVALGWLYPRLPTAFLPDEDQGILIIQAMLPPGATQERTVEVLRQVERHFLENETEAVQELITVAGFSFAGQGQNMASGSCGCVIGMSASARICGWTRSPVGPWGPSRGSATPWSSPSPRRRSSSWAPARAGICSCRTVPGWVTRP